MVAGRESGDGAGFGVDAWGLWAAFWAAAGAGWVGRSCVFNWFWGSLVFSGAI